MLRVLRVADVTEDADVSPVAREYEVTLRSGQPPTEFGTLSESRCAVVHLAQ